MGLRLEPFTAFEYQNSSVVCRQAMIDRQTHSLIAYTCSFCTRSLVAWANECTETAMHKIICIFYLQTLYKVGLICRHWRCCYRQIQHTLVGRQKLDSNRNLQTSIERHSKAKRRAPAYSRARRQIKGVVQRIVCGRLRSGCQRVRGGRLAVKEGV